MQRRTGSLRCRRSVEYIRHACPAMHLESYKAYVRCSVELRWQPGQQRHCQSSFGATPERNRIFALDNSLWKGLNSPSMPVQIRAHAVEEDCFYLASLHDLRLYANFAKVGAGIYAKSRSEEAIA